MRLLAILAGYVPWVGWDGWECHNGYLFPPGYRRGGIPPSEFFALVFYRQQVSAYQDANAQLTARLAALELKADGGQAAGADPGIGRELAALSAQLEAIGAQLSALGARTSNTGTLCHGWHSDPSAEVSAAPSVSDLNAQSRGSDAA